jgi:hypothetical protein
LFESSFLELLDPLYVIQKKKINNLFRKKTNLEFYSKFLFLKSGEFFQKKISEPYNYIGLGKKIPF